MSLVLFHRNFQRFQGGHLKVFHYFEHVRSSPSHEARIRFSDDSVWNETNPWSGLRELVVREHEPLAADVLFLAGTDWRFIEPAQRARSPVPIVNLVQDFRFERGHVQLREFLAHRAIRVCVTPELEQAVRAAGATGPVLTVPVGVDLAAMPQQLARDQRDLDCVVLATKDPRLGEQVAARVRKRGHGVLVVDRTQSRAELLSAFARARVAVLLPTALEGAYMPALESMALGAAVVCPDCVGNRSFCRDRETCVVPRRSARAIASAALELLGASEAELTPLLERASAQSTAHGLDRERQRFLELLDRVPELWQAG